MNAAMISALAAVGGSSVGALTPVLSNYVLQRSVTRRDVLTRVVEGRETLYSDFISSATHLYAEALTQSNLNLSEAAGLYALVSRIRLVAPEAVVKAAESAVRLILMRYEKDNLCLQDIPKAALSAGIEPLLEFSNVCRKDLNDLLRLRG